MLRGRQVRASVVPHLGALEQLGFLARSMCFEGSNTCTSRPNPASRTFREREITQAVVGTGTLSRAGSLRKSNSEILQDTGFYLPGRGPRTRPESFLAASALVCRLCLEPCTLPSNWLVGWRLRGGLEDFDGSGKATRMPF